MDRASVPLIDRKKNKIHNVISYKFWAASCDYLSQAAVVVVLVVISPSPKPFANYARLSDL